MITTLWNLLLCWAFEDLAELLSKGTFFFFFFLSNRPARLLSAYKDKEQFELLNTCFAKSVLKKLHHIPFDDCATQGGYLSWKLSKSELWAPLQFRHSFVPTWKIASCSVWNRKKMCRKAMEIGPNVPSTYQIHIENFLSCFSLRYLLYYIHVINEISPWS